MTYLRAAFVAGVAAVVLGSALAQIPGRGPGQGPVITQCKEEIAKFCAGKQHDGEVRTCLEAKKAEVTASCKTALDTTGPGRQRRKQ